MAGLQKYKTQFFGQKGGLQNHKLFPDYQVRYFFFCR
jgi:hypothetical protein